MSDRSRHLHQARRYVLRAADGLDSLAIEDLWEELELYDRGMLRERLTTLADRWEREASRHWADYTEQQSAHRRSMAMMRIFDAVLVSLDELEA